MDLLLLFPCFSMDLSIILQTAVIKKKQTIINNPLDNFSLVVNKSTLKHIKVPLEIENNRLKLKLQDILMKGQHIKLKVRS